MTQFAVEEAVMERLEFTEKLQHRAPAEEARVGVSPHQEQQAEHEALMRQIQGAR